MDSIVFVIINEIYNDKKYTKKLLRIHSYVSKRVLFNYCACKKFLAFFVMLNLFNK